MNYAVIFTYSFDNDCAVYLFATEEEAKKFLIDTFQQEVKEDLDLDWDIEAEISEDGWYAKIINHFTNRDDITEMRIGNIFV